MLDELSVLDLQTWTWGRFEGMPSRYNHTATLVDDIMYIYAGRDEDGNTVSDLLAIHLNALPYAAHNVLQGSQMIKSRHFCENVGKNLFIFGSGDEKNSTYKLWMLDLKTLVWEDCQFDFDIAAWNYFTYIPNQTKFLVLGNTDASRPVGHDHFR